jgi:hypothetical protein
MLRSLAIVTLLTSSLYAQTSGVIVGRVTDASGAAVLGAKVELVNQATGIKTTATASGQGDYTLPLVEPGNTRSPKT